MATPTTWNGLTVNGSSDYIVFLQRSDQQAPYTVALEERQRLNQAPAIDSRALGGRTIPFTVIRKPGASITMPQFLMNVARYFNPDGGARTLVATLEDGSTAQITADIATADRVNNTWEGEFRTSEFAWRSTTTNTDAASPLTAGGTYKALPTITITPSTSTLNRRRVTIADNTTRGLSAYIIQATFDSTGVSATANTNYVVMYQGRSIPFYVNTPNNALTKIYFRVDVDPSGSSFVDIYYGSSVANTITNDKLDKAGMALSSATFSNTQWEWDLPFTISSNPRGAAGSWVAGKFGTQASGVYTTVASESGATVDISYVTTVNANDVDGFSAVIPAGAGTTNALTNLSRGNGTMGGNLFVKKRLAGQLNWTTVDTKNGGAPTTTAIDIDNAIHIAIWGEGTGGAAQWTLAGGANLTLVLDSTKTPTVTVGSAVAARYINSAMVNTTTGDTLTFTGWYMDDVALTITTTPEKRITPASGPTYGSFTVSTDEWFTLAIGTNAWTNAVNTSSSIAWQDRFVA